MRLTIDCEFGLSLDVTNGAYIVTAIRKLHVSILRLPCPN